MTQGELEAIRERAKAATPGPWEYDGEGFLESGGGTVAVVYTADDFDGDAVDASSFDANGPFIAAARQNVPALCDALAEAWDYLARFANDSDQYRLGELAGRAAAVAEIEAIRDGWAEKQSARFDQKVRAAGQIIDCLGKPPRLLPHDELRLRCERMEAALKAIYALVDGVQPHDAAQSAYRLGLAIGAASKALEG